MARRTAHRVALLALLLTCALPCFTPSPHAREGALPGRLDDRAFWQLVNDLSEPGGFFRSDNLVSNETAFQQVIPALQTQLGSGGAYVGVGPDQNFTYIVALQPRIAFIVDIRRQNMVLHLLYKAVIEQSSDRAEFLSRLFSRKRPSGLNAATSADALLTAYATAPPDPKLYERNLQAATKRLMKQHRFALTRDDLRSLDYVYRAFLNAGPEIRYSFPRGFGWDRFPSYRELMTTTDGGGVPRSYLATEANYQTLRNLQQRNLIVPVVGDFAGPKALRAVGTFLRQHDVNVSAFYTSNVEQYLFRGEDWQQFYANVGSMPLDARSLFIRSYFNRFGYFSYGQAPAGPRSLTLLSPIPDLLAAVAAGRVQGYDDVIALSR
ncbi:MAG TPA: hypothetical protein VFK20_09605 [Vicinamibacterales bacterium]|nr:hypothetical protein [Vicinamibacterales bacterium]